MTAPPGNFNNSAFRSFFVLAKKVVKSETNLLRRCCRPCRQGSRFIYLPNLRENYKPDVIIVNIENAAHGFGASPSICRQFLDAGVDALVTGNHVWQQRDLIPFLDECKRIVRPLNYPEGLPGKGAIELELPNGKKILIAQLLGRLFDGMPLDSPWRQGD